MVGEKQPDILYTIVDEAPELASASLLPIIRSFAASAGVTIGTKDISLAGRIISAVSDLLEEDQRQSDDLAELGELVKSPDGVYSAAKCCDRRVAGSRYCSAGLSRRPADRRRARYSGSL